VRSAFELILFCRVLFDSSVGIKMNRMMRRMTFFNAVSPILFFHDVCHYLHANHNSKDIRVRKLSCEHTRTIIYIS
jgi:hypothetical protein